MTTTEKKIIVQIMTSRHNYLTSGEKLSTVAGFCGHLVKMEHSEKPNNNFMMFFIFLKQTLSVH